MDGGGSGKTVFAQYIKKLVPDFIVLNGDDYFEPTPNELAWGAFNDERFIADVVRPLQKGERAISYRPYQRLPQPHIATRKLTIKDGICIERSFMFGFDLDWDLKIWVEAPSDLSLERGLERDKMPRARAVKAWKEVWQPKEDAHVKAIDPLKTADIVIDGTKPFEVQLIK